MTAACGSQTLPSPRGRQCLYVFCTDPSNTFVMQLLRENDYGANHPLYPHNKLCKAGLSAKGKNEEPSVPRGPCSWPLRGACGPFYLSGQGWSRGLVVLRDDQGGWEQLRQGKKQLLEQVPGALGGAALPGSSPRPRSRPYAPVALQITRQPRPLILTFFLPSPLSHPVAQLWAPLPPQAGLLRCLAWEVVHALHAPAISVPTSPCGACLLSPFSQALATSFHVLEYQNTKINVISITGYALAHAGFSLLPLL